jgi:hypothetical protein
MTGDVGALNGQEAYAARDLFRRASTVHGDLLVGFFFDFVGDRVPHFGGHRTGRDGVYRDVVARELDRERLAEADDSSLRRGVSLARR